MNLLIIGHGGREHALAWKAAQSPIVKKIYIAPGNAGTALEAKLTLKTLQNVPIDVNDIDALVSFAKQRQIQLTLIGPEQPLASGIVDAFRATGLKIVGPTQAAAQLESSKAYMKAFLQRHGIPTANYRIFTDSTTALAYIRYQPLPTVIKADGLAAGKGVIIAQNLREAEIAIHSIMTQRIFGNAGNRIIVEQFLTGEEVSFIALVDGQQFLPLATSQDYKRLSEGDQGPNTGGMGACSPTPIVSATLQQQIIQTIIQPTLRGMVLEGTPYSGFLYAGLMIDRDGQPHVIEFNCRLGDPEAQLLMLRLRSDLVSHCLAAVDGQLEQQHIQWDQRVALGVVLAADGYPENYKTGAVIEGVPLPHQGDRTEFSNDALYKIFHAGTKYVDQKLTVNGGRVLCVTALGNSFFEAHQRAYYWVNQIHCASLYYRRDIGAHLLNHHLPL